MEWGRLGNEMLSRRGGDSGERHQYLVLASDFEATSAAHHAHRSRVVSGGATESCAVGLVIRCRWSKAREKLDVEVGLAAQTGPLDKRAGDDAFHMYLILVMSISASQIIRHAGGSSSQSHIRVNGANERLWVVRHLPDLLLTSPTSH